MQSQGAVCQGTTSAEADGQKVIIRKEVRPVSSFPDLCHPEIRNPMNMVIEGGSEQLQAEENLSFLFCHSLETWIPVAINLRILTVWEINKINVLTYVIFASSQ
ncbi:hypothetical protein PoB_001472400 [Plakobranchus ocellatus]|uniref:Uncharacterized protein n=1 Tax=Plakobranchus ocellatus TaxID=259542 RepID=A0AAV3Z1E5_9GAST|nr:hypothetical protein PoB_001472400 [Plakobranchus ocellatus]